MHPSRLLFVYGTLRRSDAHPMHTLLEPATFVGHATFQGKLYDVGTYPAAVPSDDPAARVHGELYALHDPHATLARLDRYEACQPSDPPPHEYVRVTLPVTLSRKAEGRRQKVEGRRQKVEDSAEWKDAFPARELFSTPLENGEILPAQIYLYHRPVAALTPVPSGDYLLWRVGQAAPPTA